MIGELVGYLLKNAAALEMEGIKSKSGGMWREFFDELNKEKERMVTPVMDEFFCRMRKERELAMRQFARVAIFVSGLMILVVGLGFALDEIVGIKGAGFAIVGLIALASSFLLSER
jgi:F0F1-type ATP synthase assembly protein I